MSTDTSADRRVEETAGQAAPARGPAGEWLQVVVRHRLFWPVVALILLLLLNVVFTHNFFSIRLQQGHLYGSLISILLFGAPLILVALGMTMVIATGGIDLSVGAVVAISGAMACWYISKETDQNSITGMLVAVALSLGLGLALGVWNGVLVARIGIQPIVATLILMVAGRGVAQLITGGQIISIISTGPYSRIGGGYLLTLPFSIFIVAAVVALAAGLTRRTALGLMVESVGGNAEASRLVGINARRIKIIVYVFCAFCAAIAGLILSSNVSSADGNNAGLWIELDAILAVVIGGTSLTGGRFYIGGTIVGALIIQTLTTTIYTIGVPTQSTMVFKAVVVILVCLMQSPVFRQKVFSRRRRPPSQPEPTAPAPAAQQEVAA